MEGIRKDYNPYKYYDENPELREALDQLSDGVFSPENPGLFTDLVNNLKHND